MSVMIDRRLYDIERFYKMIARLDQKIGGARMLASCSGRLTWPARGIFFFQENGEERSDSGTGLRIVRVGTHALKEGSGTRLWRRLSQHKGRMRSGGGNHRGSIFRLIVGTALIERNGHDFPSWGQGNHAVRMIRQSEHALERLVSETIGEMPFLWLNIDDEPGPDSLRGYIERNSIALLSNYNKPAIDPPSQTWLGHHCNRERVRR